ncbi:helix-turn-helix domain-containing protein [Peribacillus saganii]|uniref:Helix-turn-helix domain-containing protein n=1 Tax=Peribacillus saganii TaxID=2303992 RepID=A0A372LSZ6_9BACI|nr:helix-turn-helix domain-containing protein [Peribacillus saganii]RFU71017.1 helix-turn-helix domain-containing protein [Peribacillus saganii]
MEERKVFDKRNPTEGERNFIPLPSDARHYIHHAKMSADKLFLYALIIDHWNPKDGYAWPSVESLAVKYGKAPDTTSRHLEDLKAAGLIDFPEKGYYVPLIPLDEAEFFRQFPDADARYRETIKRYDERKQAGRERMRLWRLAKGYVD